MPDSEMLRALYESSSYLDSSYKPPQSTEIFRITELIGSCLALLLGERSNWRSSSARFLDYGCGDGTVLRALQTHFPEVELLGVEFDDGAARFASVTSGITVVSSDALCFSKYKDRFTAIHLGDVLEHIENPRKLLDECLSCLVPGGFLIVRGPIESNSSLVFYISALWGWLGHLTDSKRARPGIPYHLYRATRSGMLALVTSIAGQVKVVSTHVYDDGWPYILQTFPRRLVGKASVFISRALAIFGVECGNRIQIILRREY